MEEELSQEAFDKLKERIQVLEEIIFVEMKLTADRTDISACDKVNRIKGFIEQVREEPDEPEEIKLDGSPEIGNGNEEDVKSTNGDGVNLKRTAEEETHPDASEAKTAKPNDFIGDGPDGEKKPPFEAGGYSDDEEADVDCCVVCGLHRGVFKEDTGRELNHYLSHGFNILKEFDILKPDDTLFLICNICNSPFPRKCHVNFRKHLVSEHMEKIVEIFRET